MYRYICTEIEDCSEESSFSKVEMLVEGGGNNLVQWQGTPQPMPRALENAVTVVTLDRRQ